MSTIDLERLIVRQRYFIPIETSKLIESVQTELEADWGSIGGIKAWYLYEEHKNSFCFIFSMIYHFVKHEVMGSESGTREYKMLVRRKKENIRRGSQIASTSPSQIDTISFLCASTFL